MVQMEIINTNLRRYTFESPKIKKWVEDNCNGKTLNLFAGKTKLDIENEIRNDIDPEMMSDTNMDAMDCVLFYKNKKMLFDTIVLDPPYAYRKAMEMYNGNYSSRFKQIADNISDVLSPNGKVVSFGYHSTFMGKKRGFDLIKMCVFAHGGAQHCTIAIIEQMSQNNTNVI